MGIGHLNYGSDIRFVVFAAADTLQIACFRQCLIVEIQKDPLTATVVLANVIQTARTDVAQQVMDLIDSQRKSSPRRREPKRHHVSRCRSVGEAKFVPAPLARLPVIGQMLPPATSLSVA